jgi:tripartite-type tricarboxylate transporter receptor subunit TctC
MADQGKAHVPLQRRNAAAVVTIAPGWRRKMPVLRAILAAFGLVFAFGVVANAADDFYKGKQLYLIVGTDTGAGYDYYARLLSRHLPKHIPGNPRVIVQNMPGAGGLRAANHLYNIAAKDGTVIGTFQRNLPLMSIVEKDNQQVRYDATRFTWLGSPSRGAGDAYMLIVRSDSPVKRIEELRGPNAPQLIVGGTAPGTQGYDVAAMLAEIIGLNMRVIPGYASANEMSMALMRKEVDGRMIGLSALRSTQKEWLEKNLVRILVQVGREDRHPDLADVPLARELVSDRGDQALIELMDAAQFMAWPFMAPPGVPAERAAILQQAFMETQQDPAYLADAERQSMELSPISGEEIRRILLGLNAKLTPDLLARYKVINAKIKSVAK